MTTTVEVDPVDPDLEVLAEGARRLQAGEVVAFPTETVYGLGALATREGAREELRDLKKRSGDKPFTHLLSSVLEVEALLENVPPKARILMDRYWPGPLTLVLPRRTGSEDMLGVRVPASPVAQQLVRLAGGPLLAPSANPEGEPPATTASEVRAYYDGRIELILDGGPAALKESSTVVRVRGDQVEVLRTGFIGPEMVHQLLAGKNILFVCTGNTCRSPMAEALFSKHLAKKLGKSVEDLPELGYQISSAGTFTGFSGRASPEAVRVMEEKGCTLGEHRTRPVTSELLKDADRVYAMTSFHRDVLERLEPSARSKIFVLADHDISDPVGSDVEGYRRSADEIEAAISAILETM